MPAEGRGRLAEDKNEADNFRYRPTQEYNAPVIYIYIYIYIYAYASRNPAALLDAALLDVLDFWTYMFGFWTYIKTSGLIVGFLDLYVGFPDLYVLFLDLYVGFLDL